jgi:hypothetical protein
MYKIVVKANEQIMYSGQEVIEALNEINVILISLHRMGSYYFANAKELNNIERAEYEKETTRFIDECHITKRLSKIRSILSKKFDLSLGDDDMDDLERAETDLEYWTAPGDRLK